MADLPTLTPAHIAALIPEASDIAFLGKGGQKLAYRGTIAGRPYALKFVKAPAELGDDVGQISISRISQRVVREFETMQQCASPHMVKAGPIGLGLEKVNGQWVMFFSEEFISGSDLQTLSARGPLSTPDVARLGRQVGDAIQALSDLGKVHRDVKPANIMRRDSGDFVLLDAGFAFDHEDVSLSVGPVGTWPFFSPEQFLFEDRRRQLDARSDFFALGVTMYCMATGVHPFWRPQDSPADLRAKITQHTPRRPSQLIATIPEPLDEAIMRLLGKRPSLRFRNGEQLRQALQGL